MYPISFKVHTLCSCSFIQHFYHHPPARTGRVFPYSLTKIRKWECTCTSSSLRKKKKLRPLPFREHLIKKVGHNVIAAFLTTMALGCLVCESVCILWWSSPHYLHWYWSCNISWVKQHFWFCFQCLHSIHLQWKELIYARQKDTGWMYMIYW